MIKVEINLELGGYQLLLKLRDVPGDVDLLRTRLNAVEDGVATPDAVLRIDR